MAQKKNVHDGHRERVKSEFLAHGFNDSTPEHKILEMLLFFGIPRKDTNEIAHDLLNRFGSLAGVFEADVSELKKVDGVGDNAAALLKLMVPVTKRYLSEKKFSKKSDNIVDISNFYEYINLQYFGKTTELFMMTCFDVKGKLTGTDILAEGDNSEVKISIRTVISTALRREAAYAVISHNHPKGFAVPSAEDADATGMINEALKSIKVNLLDHIVVSDDDYVSMRQSRSYNHLFK